jgi:hypothetical protein
MRLEANIFSNWFQEPISMPPPPPPNPGSALQGRTLKESSTNQAIVLPVTSALPLKMSPGVLDLKPTSGESLPVPISGSVAPSAVAQVKTEAAPAADNKCEVYHNNLPQTLLKENTRKCPLKVSKLQERRRKQQQQQQQQQQQSVNNNNNNCIQLISPVPTADTVRCCPETGPHLQTGKFQYQESIFINLFRSEFTDITSLVSNISF